MVNSPYFADKTVLRVKNAPRVALRASDYYYIKALENILEKSLTCGITHANGCSNIGKITSLFLGLGISELVALVDSDNAGIRERNKLITSGAYEDNNILTTHDIKNEGKSIEDVFARDWYMKNIMDYTEPQIKKANEKDVKDLPNEVKKKLKIKFMEKVDDALEIALIK